MQARVEAARRLVAGPRVAVTDIEAHIGARYTYDTLAWLTRRAPGVRFVWIMGADNLSQFHLWRHWRAIADLVADRRRRPARLDVAGDVEPGGGCARALAGPGSGGGALRRAQPARLPVPARAALGPVLDGAAEERLNPARGEMKAGRLAKVVMAAPGL